MLGNIVGCLRHPVAILVIVLTLLYRNRDIISETDIYDMLSDTASDTLESLFSMVMMILDDLSLAAIFEPLFGSFELISTLVSGFLIMLFDSSSWISYGLNFSFAIMFFWYKGSANVNNVVDFFTDCFNAITLVMSWFGIILFHVATAGWLALRAVWREALGARNAQNKVEVDEEIARIKRAHLNEMDELRLSHQRELSPWINEVENRRVGENFDRTQVQKDVNNLEIKRLEDLTIDLRNKLKTELQRPDCICDDHVSRDQLDRAVERERNRVGSYFGDVLKELERKEEELCVERQKVADRDQQLAARPAQRSAEETELGKAVAEKDATIATLRQELATATSTANNLHSEVQTLQQDKSNLESRLNGTIATLRQEKLDLETTHTANVSQLERRISTVEQEKSAIEATCENSKGQLNVQISDLLQQVQDLNLRVSVLQQQAPRSNEATSTSTAFSQQQVPAPIRVPKPSEDRMDVDSTNTMLTAPPSASMQLNTASSEVASTSEDPMDVDSANTSAQQTGEQSSQPPLNPIAAWKKLQGTKLLADLLGSIGTASSSTPALISNPGSDANLITPAPPGPFRSNPAVPSSTTASESTSSAQNSQMNFVPPFQSQGQTTSSAATTQPLHLFTPSLSWFTPPPSDEAPAQRPRSGPAVPRPTPLPALNVFGNVPVFGAMSTEGFVFNPTAQAQNSASTSIQDSQQPPSPPPGQTSAPQPSDSAQPNGLEDEQAHQDSSAVTTLEKGKGKEREDGSTVESQSDLLSRTPLDAPLLGGNGRGKEKEVLPALKINTTANRSTNGTSPHAIRPPSASPSSGPPLSSTPPTPLALQDKSGDEVVSLIVRWVGPQQGMVSRWKRNLHADKKGDCTKVDQVARAIGPWLHGKSQPDDLVDKVLRETSLFLWAFKIQAFVTKYNFRGLSDDTMRVVRLVLAHDRARRKNELENFSFVRPAVMDLQAATNTVKKFLFGSLRPMFAYWTKQFARTNMQIDSMEHTLGHILDWLQSDLVMDAEKTTFLSALPELVAFTIELDEYCQDQRQALLTGEKDLLEPLSAFITAVKRYAP